MKIKRIALVLIICLTLLFSFSCGETPNTPQPGGNTVIDDGNDDYNGGGAKQDEITFSSDYIPTTFDAESVTATAEKLGDGVRLIKAEYSLNNGDKVVVYSVEADLSKADIQAGGIIENRTLKKAVPYTQLTAWENDNAGLKVVAASNADFFGTSSVNAFVKDGVIIKDSHNDNGSYDYKNSASDVPASAPMLFGVKEGKAQIAAIKNYTGDVTTAAVKQSLVQSKLFYAAKFTGITDSFKFEENVSPYSNSDSLIYLNEKGTSFNCRARSIVVEITDTDGVKKVTAVNTIESKTEVTPTEKVSYAVAHPDYAKSASVKTAAIGAELSIEVGSEDGLWNGYTTILGCRQALVTGGQIASTVTLENSNGAQSKNVPRTGVGIKQDGTAVLFTVEGLTYGKYGSSQDSKGLNLPQFADFIRYYGCTDAANFDGGGSTQLIVKDNNGKGEAKVKVRSSDTGSSDVSSSRSVLNTFLVTTKN